MSSYLFTYRPGILSTQRLVHNPFAVKNATPTRSMADSTEHRESRPIIAPPTLTLGRPPDSDNNVLKNDRIARSEERMKAYEFPDVTKTVSPSKFLCRPSSLDAHIMKLGSRDMTDFQRNNVTSSLRPSSSNPFLSVGLSSAVPVSSESNEVSEVTSTRESSLLTSVNNTMMVSASVVDSSSVLENVNDAAIQNNSLENSQLPQSNYINNVAQTSSARYSSSDSQDEFIFGQNMNERVKNVTPVVFGFTNGTRSLPPEGLFAQGIIEANNVVESKIDEFVDQNKNAKSLSESALEYESRQVKRTYEEVAVVTGEEDESNVMQINCKLFAFEKSNSSWVERGRGLMRLNDKELEANGMQSRLVMRTQGSLRVILNTKVWAGMSVDRPSSKSVRITALDGDSVKVFLISASPKDSEQLFAALDWRVTTLKSVEDKKPVSDQDKNGQDLGSCLSSTNMFQCSSHLPLPPTPTSPFPETVSQSCNSSGAPSLSLVTQGPGITTKKRRITPPMFVHEDDLDSSNSSSGLEPRVQEKCVDSTADSNFEEFKNNNEEGIGHEFPS